MIVTTRQCGLLDVGLVNDVAARRTVVRIGTQAIWLLANSVIVCL